MNIALITARGGSKGIPRKNIINLGGKPLIAWTIEAGLKAKEIDLVYVSTEDSEIANISREYGAKIIKRPLELSGDYVTSDAVIEHAINYLKNQIDLSMICLLQPTSPLRIAKDIDLSFDVYKSSLNIKCVTSVFEPKLSISKAYKQDENGYITGVLSPDAPNCRRQDLPAVFLPNGAVYLFHYSDFMLFNKIPKYNIKPYIMDEKNSVDIDELIDLYQAEKILKERENDKS